LRREKIDAFIIGCTVHDAHYREVRGAQGNANFFVHLPDGRLGHALSSIEMARDIAVIPIFIPGVRTPEEKHMVFTDEKKVYRHWESDMHTSVIFMA